MSHQPMYVITNWAERIHAASERKDITRCGLRYYSDAYQLSHFPTMLSCRELCLRGCFPQCPFCQVAIRSPRMMQKHVGEHYIMVSMPKRDDAVA